MTGHRIDPGDAGRGRDLTRAGVGAVASLLVALFLIAMSAMPPDPIAPLLGAAYLVAGAPLVVRRPRNPIGWVLLAIAAGFPGLASTAPTALLDRYVSGQASLIDVGLIWYLGWAGSLVFLGFLVLLIIFPTGQLPAVVWRRRLTLALGIGVAVSVLIAIAPTIDLIDGNGTTRTVANPLAVAPDARLWGAVSVTAVTISLLGLCAVGLLGLLARYRREGEIQRLQIRWLLASIALSVLAVAIALVALALSGSDLGGLAWIPAMVAYPMVPVSVAIAVLRYHLLDIDRLISRTIAYGLITAVLAAVFVAIILLLQAVLAPFTQGQTIAVAASTLVVFALFQPVRRRVQLAVDRRFDRARIDADRTSAAFAQRLRDEVDIEAVMGDLRGTVRHAVKPSSIGLWLREGDR